MPTTKTATDREGFGIAYLEAQLFGVPVVATRNAGVDEAVHDGVTGLLVDDTPDALSAAVTRLLHDADLRRRLGEAVPQERSNRMLPEAEIEILSPLATFAGPSG